VVDWSVLKNPELKEVVEKAVKHVDKLIAEGRSWRDFEAYEVTSKHWLLRKLIEAGILKISYKSSNHTFYMFAVPLEEVKERLSLLNVSVSLEEEKKTEELPKDFWDVIEGYDDIKEIFIASIKAQNPIHILLCGPPSTGKSLMLYEIERLKGSVFLTAGTATKVGIRDILLSQKPRYLIIDELDKISSPDDLSVLLTLMETGRVVVAKHGVHADEYMKTWVFAGANVITKLPPELKDRFQIFYLKPYDKETLIRVITKTLVKREGVHEDLAKYIAEKVASYSDSVREAIRLSRICSTKEDVDKYVNIFRKYRL
jgi:Holliday junction DNA helicase RuvB